MLVNCDDEIITNKFKSIIKLVILKSQLKCDNEMATRKFQDTIYDSLFLKMLRRKNYITSQLSKHSL